MFFFKSINFCFDVKAAFPGFSILSGVEMLYFALKMFAAKIRMKKKRLMS